MKSLHRPDLFGWSHFDEKRNVDFCGVAWIRPGGNVLIDPLPMTEHDRAHLAALGGATLIIITNSDHTRGAQGLAQELRATLCGPRAERGSFSKTAHKQSPRSSAFSRRIRTSKPSWSAMAGPFSTTAGVRLRRCAGAEHRSQVAARSIESASKLPVARST